MREILFRGIDEGTKEWVYGYYFERPSEFGGEKRYYIFDDKSISKYNVLPETVGQYTGLIDKNGKKIFEGDIHERENHFFIVKYGKYKDCETDEDGYGWYFEYTHRKGCEGFCGDEERYVNIIGNIHDNPELLERSENGT